jgi:hypothetical protein
MKVKELIALLSKENPDEEITIYTPQGLPTYQDVEFIKHVTCGQKSISGGYEGQMNSWGEKHVVLVIHGSGGSYY